MIFKMLLTFNVILNVADLQCYFECCWHSMLFLITVGIIRAAKRFCNFVHIFNSMMQLNMTDFQWYGYKPLPPWNLNMTSSLLIIVIGRFLYELQKKMYNICFKTKKEAKENLLLVEAQKNVTFLHRSQLLPTLSYKVNIIQSNYI